MRPLRLAERGASGLRFAAQGEFKARRSFARQRSGCCSSRPSRPAGRTTSAADGRGHLRAAIRGALNVPVQ